MDSSLHPALAAQLSMLESVAKLFHPYVETALHDLRTEKIVGLFNSISRRKVGDPSEVAKFIGGHRNEFPDTFEPYYKTNWDGKKFKCVSITIRDETGKPVGLACINFDTSTFGQINTNIAQLLATASNTANPIEQFTEDWQARVNECIDNFLKEENVSLASLTRQDKSLAVNRLYKHGLFNYRGAAAYIAVRLHISRATVYNYLSEGE
jgi:D-arginine utilization repressor